MLRSDFQWTGLSEIRHLNLGHLYFQNSKCASVAECNIQKQLRSAKIAVPVHPLGGITLEC